MISILIPTAGKRIQGLCFQIVACLHQAIPVDIHVLVDCDNFDDVPRTLFGEASSVHFHHVPRDRGGKWGHAALRWAIEGGVELQEWLMVTGDDDCILPWTCGELSKHISADVDMITGHCIPVYRNLNSCSSHMIGEQIALAQITGSCCLFRTSRVKEVGYDDSIYEADWTLISKMMKFPHKKTDLAMFVMPMF